MSKSLKKLIDINRLREFKNKLVGTDSAYVQTGAVDQTVAGTKAFSEPIVGSVTGSSGSCTGNAASANIATKADSATNATYANWLRTSSHPDYLFRAEWDGTYFWTYVNDPAGSYVAVRVARSDSSGNADTATKLATARTIALSGAATGTATGFDGSGNITIPVTSLDASKLTGTASVSTTGNAASANIATKADSATKAANADHATSADSATKAANADHATSADSATRATSADRASAANCVQSQTSDYHEIRFDWGSQVPGCVGLRIDATDIGGIVTTNRLVSDIRAQWYAAYPDGAEAHNAMWGGRDITAAFDAGTVSANIANGTFKDIFPGDYITKQVTIGGTAYTVNWVIADCDYWINKGDTATTVHHVAIVPQVPIFYADMNATNTTEGGYMGSRMFKETIPACATGIVNAFGSSHILTFRDGISNRVDTSVSSGIPQWTGTPGWWGEMVSVQCNLMSEKMVYGAPVCAAGAMDNTMATRQMSAFRLSERLINYSRQSWWLRDVASSAAFASVDGNGPAGAAVASGVYGVRPFALLK